jgi:hypothetical protein
MVVAKNLWVRSLEPASQYPSRVYNFEVAARFVGNLYVPDLDFRVF